MPQILMFKQRAINLQIKVKNHTYIHQDLQKSFSFTRYTKQKFLQKKLLKRYYYLLKFLGKNVTVIFIKFQQLFSSSGILGTKIFLSRSWNFLEKNLKLLWLWLFA